jgi:hypothetical protein
MSYLISMTADGVHSMDIKLVKVPRGFYNGQDGKEALFTPEAVEWAMNQILAQQ